ncbi:inactive protein kinase SELMODRAFT_444075-like [Lolium rigidum]|uniref:inactive protein kinase SELMODRAFT_444075-like n=1 Tax=Lolium rigidum TaxID=89674 RepID=UPI001F5D9099|nr:inactive protein kinase SELMODRAFT_444075-like [Lolium rigidum]
MAAARGGAGEPPRPQPQSRGATVVVAARAAPREIPRAAAAWALAHVARHGDTVLLLVLMPPPPPAVSGKRPWGFPFFAGGCATGHAAAPVQRSDVSELCTQMTLRLRDLYDPTKVDVKVRVVHTTPSGGVVAAESKGAQASWVVLDRDLKLEERHCMQDLQCNIVFMRRSRPKVVRLNLAEKQLEEPAPPPPPQPEPSGSDGGGVAGGVEEGETVSIRGPEVTPSCSTESETPCDSTDVGASSVSSSDPGASPLCGSETDASLKKELTEDMGAASVSSSDHGTYPFSASEAISSAAASLLQPWMADILQRPASSKVLTPNRPRARRTPTADALLEKISKLDLLTEISAVRSRSDLNFRGNVRDVVSLSRSAPPGPPPLCSVCQHKTPVFGKPPRWFSYGELEYATGGFSRANFLAEGGFGSVHRGVLPDGQAIAVKQYKLASSQGDVEFCSEVEVLSCAQHRNVVMLIGFCVEDKRRLLVYEYICNRSLDTHLYGRNRETLGWAARQKIAVGAARGLRYLHEECRVGCIIHRDMRPNNILVTHDFEPLVGDFGLARWQPDGDMGVETRVIGTFGYLAPEYAQSGQITEKADVYSFGVVLVELVTGRKAVDINRPKGQQFLTEWARPLLEDHALDNLIDPRLEDRFCENEVYCMLHAANLCIRRDPHSRPRMSHVLRILEGDMVESGCISATSSVAGSMSRRMMSDRQHYQEQSSPVQPKDVSEVNRSYETLRSAWDSDRQELSDRFWYPSAADCSRPR